MRADLAVQPSMPRLGRHVLVLWLVLVGSTWLVDVERGVYDADDGALLVQVQVLADTGEWWAENPGAGIDPDGRFLGIAHALTRDDEILAFPVRPLMTWITTTAWEVGGVRAATLLGITGVTVAAWSTAQLAATIDRRSKVLAFWLTGLGSPLVFQGLALQGHGVVAGLVGLALWATWKARTAKTGAAVVLVSSAAACTALAGMIRREVLLLGLAIAVGRVITWLRRRDARLVVTDLGPLIGAIVGVGLDHVLVVRMLDFAGRTFPTSTARFGLIEDRFLSAVRFVLPGHHSDPQLAMFLAFGAASFCLVGSIQYVRSRNERELLGCLSIGAILLMARLIVEPTPLIPGFIPAFPLALVMLVLAWHLVSEHQMVREHLVVFTTLAVLTILTQYPAGGGFEWGTRYFSLAILVLVPIGAPALVRLGDAMAEPSLKRPLLIALTVIALAPTAMALIAQRNARTTNAANIEAGYALAAELGSNAVISTHPEIPRVNTEHLTRGVPWFHVWAQELEVFLPLIEAQGYTQVPLFTRDLEETVKFLGGTGWQLRDGTIRPENPGTVVLAVLERAHED